MCEADEACLEAGGRRLGEKEVLRRGKLDSKFDTGSEECFGEQEEEERSWRRSCFTGWSGGLVEIEWTACWTSDSSGADIRASRLTPNTWKGSSIGGKDEDGGGDEGAHQPSLLSQHSIPNSGQGKFRGKLSDSFSSSSSSSSSSSFTLQLLWLLRLSQSW